MTQNTTASPSKTEIPKSLFLLLSANNENCEIEAGVYPTKKEAQAAMKSALEQNVMDAKGKTETELNENSAYVSDQNTLDMTFWNIHRIGQATGFLLLTANNETYDIDFDLFDTETEAISAMNDAINDTAASCCNDDDMNKNYDENDEYEEPEIERYDHSGSVYDLGSGTITYWSVQKIPEIEI